MYGTQAQAARQQRKAADTPQASAGHGRIRVIVAFWAAGSDTVERMYISLQPALTAGRVPWPEFARLASRLGFPGVDVDLTKAQAAGVDALAGIPRWLFVAAEPLP